MRMLTFMLALGLLAAGTAAVSAETASYSPDLLDSRLSFPNYTGPESDASQEKAAAPSDERSLLEKAFWPFGDSDESVQERKSTRKAFFLSMLLPGLGEAYVGSKRSLLFLGVEAVAWWMYITNTNEGENLEDDFHDFANTYWHYTDTVDSNGDPLDYNYWKWLQWHFREVGFDADIDPQNHAAVDSLLEKTVNRTSSSISGYSVHHLPSTKTQQYYEMIGKYPQFVYGWEDIDELNPTIRQDDDTIKYDEGVENIDSDLRMDYEDMRKESNDKLKAGQRGVHLMILNRVISAIHAARMAYNHNQEIESELSQVRVRFVQKHIIDNEVPMLMISKKF